MSECIHDKRKSKLFRVYSFPCRWLRRRPHHVHASISVNLVVLQGLMRTPQDCKVMWVAACNSFVIWSHIRGWQYHRMVWNATPSSEFGNFYMELPILIYDLITKTFYYNVIQNGCRPTTSDLSLSGVDLLAHFLLLIDSDSDQKNELTSSQLCQAHVRRCTRLMIG